MKSSRSLWEKIKEAFTAQPSSTDSYSIFLTRGTLDQHAISPFRVKAGNFSIVTDKNELRFHDGVVPGGHIIKVPRETYEAIRKFYEESVGF